MSGWIEALWQGATASHMGFAKGAAAGPSTVYSAAVRISRRGEVTLPKHVLEQLGLGAGDEVDIEVRAGEARLIPVRRPPDRARRIIDQLTGAEDISFSTDEITEIARAFDEATRHWSEDGELRGRLLELIRDGHRGLREPESQAPGKRADDPLDDLLAD